jgi:hypothetical protein
MLAVEKPQISPLRFAPVEMTRLLLGDLEKTQSPELIQN